MKLKHYEIEPFMELLYSLSLKGKNSRMRTRLIRKMDEYMQSTLNPDRDELIHQYAQKDENDKPVLNEEGNQVLLIPETAEEYHREFTILMNEDYIIEENESTLDILLSVGDSLLDCDLEFSEQKAVFYDQVCEKFEELIEEYENKEV